MPILTRLLAAYAMLTALIVAVQFIFAVDPGWWQTIDWLMFASIVITLEAAQRWKRRADAAGYPDGEVGVRRFLDANVPLVAVSALLIAFAFQWSDSLNDNAQGMANGGGLWAYIDSLFVAVAGAVGARMWSDAGRASAG